MLLLRFTADWCRPCKAFGPIADSFANDLPEGWSYMVVDADQHPVLMSYHKIASIPTMILLEDDVEVMRVTGATTKEQLTKIFLDGRV